MAGSQGVFLSAVSSEFGEARKELARSLNAKRFEVQVQEEFEQGGDTLLQKIHDYVKECQAVVAIVGTRSGAFPKEDEARPFADIVSAVKLTPGEYSYTEWELIFARHYRRKMFLFFAASGYEPDRPTPEGDRPEIQARVVSWLRSQGWESSEFTDVKDLQLGVWLSKLDTVVGVRRSATTSEEGLALAESAGRSPEPRDPADANRLPPNDHPIVGRDFDLEDLRDVIDERHEKLVMVIGPAGIGKRALLNELGNSDDLPTDFGNGAGIAPLLEEGEGLEDLQQAIWSQFFIADDPSKVDPVRRTNDLQDVESLIFLPDIDSSAEHIEELRRGMPKSFFCISAQENATKGLPGEEIPLDPLDDDAVIDLFKDRYGRDVADDLLPGLLQLCAGGNPGEIELLAKDARTEYRKRRRSEDNPLAGWLTDRIGAGPAPSAAGSDAAATATAAMAAVDRPVPRKVLADVAGSSSAIDDGVDNGKFEPGSPRYRLNPVLVAAEAGAQSAEDHDELMSAVFEHTLHWIDDATHTEIFENRSFIVRMMQWGTESGDRLAASGDTDAVERARQRWQGVIALGTSAEWSMARGGRHGAWEEVLDGVQHAAEAALATLAGESAGSDGGAASGGERDERPRQRRGEAPALAPAAVASKEALGWALHERGSRALLRDELDDARVQFNRALRHRTSDAGRNLTRKNMMLVPLAVLPFTVLFVLAALGTSVAVVQFLPDPSPPAIDISPDAARFYAGVSEDERRRLPVQEFALTNVGEGPVWVTGYSIVDESGDASEVFVIHPGNDEADSCEEPDEDPEDEVEVTDQEDEIGVTDQENEVEGADGKTEVEGIDRKIEVGDYCTVVVEYTGARRATDLLKIEIASGSDADPTGDESAVLVALP